MMTISVFLLQLCLRIHPQGKLCFLVGGPKATCVGCVGFATFSVMIEKFLDRHSWIIGGNILSPYSPLISSEAFCSRLATKRWIQHPKQPLVILRHSLIDMSSEVLQSKILLFYECYPTS